MAQELLVQMENAQDARRTNALSEVRVVRVTPFRFGGPEAGETAKTLRRAVSQWLTRRHERQTEEAGVPKREIVRRRNTRGAGLGVEVHRQKEREACAHGHRAPSALPAL